LFFTVNDNNWATSTAMLLPLIMNGRTYHNPALIEA